MEEVTEKVKVKKTKKKFTINGYSIWKVFAYFVIYSILGYIMETGSGIVRQGILESRKGFLYGPFCPIYGLGAVVMLIGLKPFRKNNYLLFLGGIIVGGVVEYAVSFFGELFFKTKWWDYFGKFLNINGRICLEYSLIWGALAIFLIRGLQPKVDKFITWSKKKLGKKFMKTSLIVVMVFLLVDGIMTAIGLKMFYSRLVCDYNLKVKNQQEYIADYKRINSNAFSSALANKMFNNKFMLKTFPNLTMMSEDGSTIYVHNVLKDIQPYYLKLFSPKDVKIYNLDIHEIITDKLNIYNK